MPIYVGYSQKRRTVRLLTAGGNQFWLCPPSDIELTAYVSDITNLKNHSFYWEQIKGPPVVLASTDTLSTSYPFSDTEDKTFRFYVDYGTNQEQYKDVNIYYTPTSVRESVCTSRSVAPFQASSTIPNIAQAESFIIPQATGELNSNLFLVAATAVTFDEQPLLELLQNIVKLEILTDVGYVTEPEDIYATYLAGEIPYLFPLPNGVYRFRIYYDIGPLETAVQTSPLVVCNAHHSTDEAWGIDDVYEFGKMNIGPTLSNVIHFSVLRKQYESIQGTGYAGINSGLLNIDGSIYNPASDPIPPIFVTIPRSVYHTDFPELEDSNNIYAGNNAWMTDIVRFDPSNIGN